MDLSTPSVKQVSDFFMYLYQDLNRRPSTIDGYRTAIDTLGPAGTYLLYLCGGGRENCCPSEVINKDHLQVKVGPIREMVQRKFGGFIHSICEASLRLLHVPVPGPK